MSAVEDFNFHTKQAVGNFPFLPTTLYWRVFMLADKYLKDNTTVESKYHGNIARFFAIMWRYFFENGKVNIETGNFKFPFDGRVISITQLVNINSAVDNQIRLHLNLQDVADQNLKIQNIALMGEIGLKIRKIITSNHIKWSDPDNPLNDN